MPLSRLFRLRGRSGGVLTAIEAPVAAALRAAWRPRVSGRLAARLGEERAVAALSALLAAAAALQLAPESLAAPLSGAPAVALYLLSAALALDLAAFIAEQRRREGVMKRG